MLGERDEVGGIEYRQRPLEWSKGRGERIALDAGSDPGLRSHDALPLRGHQDETFREDRVPGRLPGSTSERLPRADDPPLDVLRGLAEWRWWTRSGSDQRKICSEFFIEHERLE